MIINNTYYICKYWVYFLYKSSRFVPRLSRPGNAMLLTELIRAIPTTRVFTSDFYFELWKPYQTESDELNSKTPTTEFNVCEHVLCCNVFALLSILL